MTAIESAITELFKEEMQSIRAEFGEELTSQVVSVLARQLTEQAAEYEAEARYMFERRGQNPTYQVCVDFGALKRDLRAHVRRQAVEQLAQLRQTAALN